MTAPSSAAQAVLTAPLWMPSPHWSSRSIAESVGVSQSFVARLWRATPADAAVIARIEQFVSEHRATVIGVMVTATGSCVVLGAEITTIRRPTTPLTARGVRRLRTVLSADLVRPDVDGAATTAEFWRVVGAADSSDAPMIALTSGHVEVPMPLRGREVATGTVGWSGLVGILTRMSGATADERLGEIETRLRRWYATRNATFTWLPNERRERRSPTPALPGSRRTARERALGDDILREVRAGLAEGAFGGGDEISERALAARLHIGRARVRQALLLLADEGLITATPHGAMAVRLPAVVDIVELYVARRALGAIAVRAAGRWTPEGRDSVATLLSQLQDCADRGDVDRAQTLDLAFQNALSRASGLIRIPGMLESLAQQLLMYISILGVRYSFSPARIAAVDTAMFEAVDVNDHARAVQIWQEKMDEGQRYMLDQTDLLFGRRSG